MTREQIVLNILQYREKEYNLDILITDDIIEITSEDKIEMYMYANPINGRADMYDITSILEILEIPYTRVFEL